MNPMKQLAAIAGLALTAAAGTFWLKGPPNRLFHCDPASLQADEICLESVPADAGVVWVDARSRAEWQRDGMSGSLLWSLDSGEDMQAFEASIAVAIMTASNAVAHVVVYCGDENCGDSRNVAQRIRQLDLGPEISVLRGGWRALNEAGRVAAKKP